MDILKTKLDEINNEKLQLGNSLQELTHEILKGSEEIINLVKKVDDMEQEKELTQIAMNKLDNQKCQVENKIKQLENPITELKTIQQLIPHVNNEYQQQILITAGLF